VVNGTSTVQSEIVDNKHEDGRRVLFDFFGLFSKNKEISKDSEGRSISDPLPIVTETAVKKESTLKSKNEPDVKSFITISSLTTGKKNSEDMSVDSSLETKVDIIKSQIKSEIALLEPPATTETTSAPLSNNKASSVKRPDKELKGEGKGKFVSLVSTDAALLVTALSLSDPRGTLADLPLFSEAAYALDLMLAALSATDLFNCLMAADWSADLPLVVDIFCLFPP
jgi:hypothetical protein